MASLALDTFDDIIQETNEEVDFSTLYTDNSERDFWDRVINSTTNVPGVLDEEDRLPTQTSNSVSTYYMTHSGGSFQSVNLSVTGIQNRRIASTLQEENICDKIFENLKEDDQTTEAEPSSAISSRLYPHQKQALSWMIAKENNNILPPFWKQYQGYCMNTITNEKRQHVKSIQGGILADDMGLGKTLEMISLIMTNFMDGKPLAYPLSDSEKIANELANEKQDKIIDGEQTTASIIQHSPLSSEVTNDAIAVRNTTELESAIDLHSQQDNSGKDNSDRVLKRMNIHDDDKEADDTEGNHSPAKYGCLEKMEDNQDDVTDFKHLPVFKALEVENYICKKKRAAIWLNMKDEKETADMEGNNSPANYGGHLEDMEDNFKEVKPLPLLEDLDMESYLGRNSLEDFNETSSSEPGISSCETKLLHHDSVATSSAQGGDNKPDFVIDVSDCDSVITIPDSDDEELCNPIPSSSNKSKVDEELLETIIPSWEKEKKDVFLEYDPLTGRCQTSGPRGTLIICPTSVLYNWVDQFKQHVDKTVNINLYVHYGKNRSLDAQFLKEQDVVITTYHTVIADNKNTMKGPLYNTEWLRIVLDEGHTIRNPKTCTAKLIFELKAQRRWVLSGTPIQNSLEDLWSIINFLKVEPLTDKRCWNRTIAYPMAKADNSASQRVFHLMRTLSLRRTKTQQVNGKPVLDLPARNVILKKLPLSQEQRKTYDLLETEGKILISQYIRDNTVQDHLYEIYVAQLRLRQFCCHPKLVFKAVVASSTVNDHNKYNKSYEENAPPPAEQGETCPICLKSPENAVISPQGHAYCWTCIQPAHGPHQTPVSNQQLNVIKMNKLMNQLNSAIQAEEECILCQNTLQDAVITGNGHIYCTVCFKNNPDLTIAFETISAANRKSLIGELLMWLDSDEEYKECPICYIKAVEIGPKMAAITFCGHQFCSTCIEQHCAQQPTCPMCRQHVDRNKLIKVPRKLTEGSHNFDEWKSSAKLDALMTALTELHQMDPSIKSIVVSQFTSLLDLIEKTLREKSFVFTRLDGKMTQNKRLQAMKMFSDTGIGSPTVFLLSLKAGGVGINLTAASRVFLMEPAWNPAAEEQCFDRCHRLGQTRDVEITKFIIENSVEENMLKLQDKKRGLMNGAFPQKLSKEQRRQNYINDLIDFFPDFR